MACPFARARLLLLPTIATPTVNDAPFWEGTRSEPQLGTLKEGREQAMVTSDESQGQVELLMQLFQVEAGQVGHLHLLEVPPQPLHRVEVRRVRRQRLQAKAIRPCGGHELGHV